MVESTSRYFSHRGANLIASPDSENERVSCCHRKTFCSKLKSVVLHVTCTRAHAHNILVANSILAIEMPTSTRCVLRGHICACVLTIGLCFVTRQEFCTLCLIVVYGNLYHLRFSCKVLMLCVYSHPGGNGTYVINKQSPNKQIWLSSPVR